MKPRHLALVAAALAVGCHKNDPTPSAESTAQAAESGAAPEQRAVERAGRAGASMGPLKGQAAQMKAVMSPADLGYPAAGIKAIDASCKAPWTRLEKAGAAVGDDYGFPWVAQALFANKKLFTVVDGAPSSSGEVSVEVHKKGDYFAVARCGDAATCTKLAAMFKDVSKKSSPETGCGDLPDGLGVSTKVKSLEVGAPSSGDTLAACARIGACTVAKDPATSEDPGSACQRAPSSFKTSCAEKSSCDDVLACLKP
jgi:hypothetical protein